MTRYTVGQVARMAHITVRTLHHYDEIGLLVPSDRSDAGYRQYSPADLERLHQILLFRELDFSLEAIARLLEDPTFDRIGALRAQRSLLADQVRKKEAVLRAVDLTLEALEKGETMAGDSLFEGFDSFDHAEYAEEAERRWGDTDAYRESMRRTKRYGKREWAEMKAEGDALLDRWAELLGQGRTPEEDEVVAVAERHRLHIDRWFYPCSRAMHEKLSELYTTDARFEATYESRSKGLAAFVAASIRANAERGRREDEGEVNGD